MEIGSHVVIECIFLNPSLPAKLQKQAMYRYLSSRRMTVKDSQNIDTRADNYRMVTIIHGSCIHGYTVCMYIYIYTSVATMAVFFCFLCDLKSDQPVWGAGSFECDASLLVITSCRLSHVVYMYCKFTADRHHLRNQSGSFPSEAQ